MLNPRLAKPPQTSKNNHEEKFNWQLKIWKQRVLLKGVSQVKISKNKDGEALAAILWLKAQVQHPQARDSADQGSD